MNKFVAGLLLCLSLVACDNISPSFTMNPAPEKPQPPPQEKPSVCKLDLGKTCWRETVQKITSCLQNSAAKEVFSANKQFCTNGAGKLVAFQNPTDIFTKPFDALNTPFAFQVFPDSINECFSVSGQGSNFEVHWNQSDEGVFVQMGKDELKFSCLDGQQVSIAYKSLKDCHSAEGDAFLNTVPGIEFAPFHENGVEKGWRFRFRGAPDSGDVFKCDHMP